MFTIIGAILVTYGAAASDESMSLGVNVNLRWGACILVFGLVMLGAWRFLGRRKAGAPAAGDAPRGPSDRPRGGH